MFTFWFYLACVLMPVEWFVVAKGLRDLRWITKPAPMIALIIWYFQIAGWGGYLIWFGLALFLSLAGDIILLFPKRYFIYGLVAFLSAHVCYIIGFNLVWPNLSSMWWVLILLVVAVIAYMDFHPLADTMRRSPYTQRMVGPVTAYGFIISFMLFSAWINFFRPGWDILPAALSAIGATLFFISDSTLARETFQKPFRGSRVIVMSTYLLGQLGIITGALMALAGGH
ncbi:MAG TPA: lysoplasmalogenase [Longilinea sp.]|nr:lysoplasmalogenase [Longilinea sp.]